jgi:hypothetical protein
MGMIKTSSTVSFQSIRRAWLIVKLLSPVLLLISCFDLTDMTGNTSETETGEVYGTLVFENESPAIGAVVELSPASDGPEAAALRKIGKPSKTHTTTTNRRGRYYFKDLKDGVYNIKGFFIKPDSEDTLVTFAAGIKYQGEPVDVGTDTLLTPGKIQARVYTGRGPAAGAICYIPSTSFLAITDDKGFCEISSVPVGIHTVTFKLDGYLTGKIKEVEVKSNKTAKAGQTTLEADPKEAPLKPEALL